MLGIGLVEAIKQLLSVCVCVCADVSVCTRLIDLRCWATARLVKAKFGLFFESAVKCWGFEISVFAKILIPKC